MASAIRAELNPRALNGDNAVQLVIELPADFVAMESEETIKQEVRASYALWLFRHSKVTLSKAAEIAGVDLYRFMELCKEERIPVVDVSHEELLEEVRGMAQA